ncbi:hypothetical protein SLINC_0073 [Streptomyces lincolnensis]|uniref:Uncharacterized protein n=1 Tax=Streptomyces lincolnensis TaxID=1915 RepID=A0A1B1M1J8_STRLN|nr:hypothetical protein [Streptomyces lincolnensis]ANS62297.1 hypothetical protein SLINC_0073 [Streptomyces lincolnensis]AXG51227.1 hypothetical protein SLCG_0072 [Streptomyces lincolnensis]QMV04305.1 hypothetical protein GJU35_00425 [Streptomyces lincolnensis]QMV12018.1 hypothetical protein GJU35_44495 [Streptomyces lincolnensis]
MLGRLFGRGAERTAAHPHALPVAGKRKHGTYALRALGDTRVLALVEAADAGDWAEVKAALAPFDLGRDQTVLGQLTDVDGVEEWIVRAAEEDRDDKELRATALLISGARHVSWGWEARTSALAVDVSREQWQTFYERLRIAEEHLLEAAELQPDWVTPWRHLLTSGRGMSVDGSVQEARLAAGLRRDPLNVDIHLEWVSHLQPRWGGEPGQALEFARKAFAAAPDGHPLGCAVAMAHIEDWVESDNRDCLQQPRIRTELREAAERSILHHDYERRLGWQGEYNIFAMALSLAGSSKASNVFRELDGVITEWPWTFMADPEKAYARFRKAF